MKTASPFINRVFVLCIIIGFLLVASDDMEIHQENQDEYCQMVEQYKLSNGKAGWPAFKSTDDCTK